MLGRRAGDIDARPLEAECATARSESAVPRRIAGGTGWRQRLLRSLAARRANPHRRTAATVVRTRVGAFGNEKQRGARLEACPRGYAAASPDAAGSNATQRGATGDAGKDRVISGKRGVRTWKPER